MTFSLIPAIDIIDGKLVRLFKGDYDQQTVYQKTPYEMALHYQSMGFKFIHVVDLNGANWSFSFVCEYLYNMKGV